EYRGSSAFDAGRAFCRLMCPVTVLPKHPVYGSNNWYYAYGKSSHDEILGDTEIVASQCAGLDNIPYMVIDDGWQKNNCDAPWTVTNERFRDMKALASEMASRGVRPGIWLRYLIDSKREIPEATDEWRLMRDANYLDPSHPDVIGYVKRITEMIVDWGYTLIKHDYSTADIFGAYGFAMREQMTKDGWHFYDRSRTSAEIVRDFYQAVKDAAGEDCVIIGCNTISHLCAGMYELNRTGDDTSGFDWNRTRKMGVNTLAMRLIQNGIFYMADADCVGITGAISWSLNRQWLDVLGRTGSPLFVSCKPGVLNDDEIAELRAAWAENSVQANTARPLDWMDNDYPALWEIDGEIVRYNWYPEKGATNFNP
ncbi:MAG: alpha-galactosidase, partial [Clostridia bacterium]|nr:alpha-galactosidase [Clostridia bacterium]